MFKSVFVKYISAFMLINILSIFLSTSVITTLVNTYDENNKSRTLANIAYSVTTFIIDDYTTSGEISFIDYLNKSVYPIKPMLDSLDGNVENLVIFIADGDGNVKLIGGAPYSDTYAGADGIVSQGEELAYPASVTAELEGSNGISRNDTLEGFFEEKHFTYIHPIRTKSGNVVGSVMTCTMVSDMDELLEAMIKTIIMSTLWLMLAALIAVYFITERLVSPIRAMSRASRAHISELLIFITSKLL